MLLYDLLFSTISALSLIRLLKDLLLNNNKDVFLLNVCIESYWRAHSHSVSHVYLVPDALIGVDSYGTEGGQDAGCDFCQAVVVVCGSKAKNASRARGWERILCGSRKSRNQNTLSGLKKGFKRSGVLFQFVFFFLSFFVA